MLHATDIQTAGSNSSKRVWHHVIGIQGTQLISAPVKASDRIPAVLPRPLLSSTPLQVPVLSRDTEAGGYEAKYESGCGSESWLSDVRVSVCSYMLHSALQDVEDDTMARVLLRLFDVRLPPPLLSPPLNTLFVDVK